MFLNEINSFQYLLHSRPLRPDSHRTLTLKLPLKYCLMHFYQSNHIVWARSSSWSKQKIFLLGAMSLSVSVSGRCESHFLLSRAQIIAEGACFLIILCILEVYQMWDFQYSRMRILHFNIRGYRMRILYILLYWGYENEFQPQMMKKTRKIMQLLI